MIKEFRSWMIDKAVGQQAMALESLGWGASI